MTRRGRRPHPDILTPREWEVLTLLREGASNPQIAERLGVTRDAVKYHVSEILSKLGLTSREEAAAWQPEPSARPVLRPAWARALGPIAGLWRAWPIAVRIAGAAVVAVAVAGLGLLLYGVTRSGDNDGVIVGGTRTVAASVSPTGGPSTPSTPSGVAGAIPLSLTDGVDLPANLALIVETGCTNCDGPSSSLLRVYRDANGNYVTDTLFTPDKVGLGPITVQTDKGPQQQVPIIAGIVMQPDASQIVVNLTYAYELGGGSAAPTKLFQSTDGGVTWSNFGSLDAGEYMLGDLIGGEIIAGHYDAGNPTPGPIDVPFNPPAVYRLYPSGVPIQTPAGANGSWRPIRLSDGTLGWRTDNGRLLTPGGSEVVRVNGQLEFADRAFNPPGVTAVVWSPDNSVTNSYLQVVGPNGESLGTYSLPGYMDPGVWVSGSLALGSVALLEPTPQTGGFSATSVPALIDLKNDTVQPITSLFGDGSFPRGRNLVDAAMTGPRARVTGTGSCLNVRAEPSATAAVVECAADGVLLANLGPADDVAWQKVRTPSGHEGYANVQYLDVIAPVSSP